MMPWTGPLEPRLSSVKLDEILDAHPCYTQLGRQIDLNSGGTPDLLVVVHQAVCPPPSLLSAMSQEVGRGGTVLLLADNFILLDQIRALVLANSREPTGLRH